MLGTKGGERRDGKAQREKSRLVCGQNLRGEATDEKSQVIED